MTAYTSARTCLLLIVALHARGQASAAESFLPRNLGEASAVTTATASPSPMASSADIKATAGTNSTNDITATDDGWSPTTTTWTTTSALKGRLDMSITPGFKHASCDAMETVVKSGLASFLGMDPYWAASSMEVEVYAFGHGRSIEKGGIAIYTITLPAGAEGDQMSSRIQSGFEEASAAELTVHMQGSFDALNEGQQHHVLKVEDYTVPETVPSDYLFWPDEEAKVCFAAPRVALAAAHFVALAVLIDTLRAL